MALVGGVPDQSVGLVGQTVNRRGMSMELLSTAGSPVRASAARADSGRSPRSAPVQDSGHRLGELHDE